MSEAAWLAAGAAGVGVAGAWEALAAVERTRVAAALTRVLDPLVRAGREGREPTLPELRRLWAVAAAALLAAGWLVAGVALGLVAALAAPAAVVAATRARRRRWREELRRSAPACARTMADALGAGRSIRTAIADAAASAEGAAAHELGTAARALAVGEPTEAVLLRLRLRARSHPWDTLTAAVLLQRDAGGDLATLLRELAASGEAAERAERDAHAATAQARFTAWLVLGLPFAGAVLAELAVPGFAGSLIANPLSAWFAMLAALFQLTALVCIGRLTRATR
ncbi:MAG TPA: type II secretion system F family protein [Solirubrobacteraceae bacterium]|nr:type II secretion system F family protein [Solirubrobacteraceae bacterium]